MNHDFRTADEIHHIEGLKRRDSIVRYGRRVVWYEWPEGPGGIRLPVPVTPGDECDSLAAAEEAVQRMVQGHLESVKQEWGRYRGGHVSEETVDIVPPLSKYGFRGQGRVWHYEKD